MSKEEKNTSPKGGIDGGTEAKRTKVPIIIVVMANIAIKSDLLLLKPVWFEFEFHFKDF